MSDLNNEKEIYNSRFLEAQSLQQKIASTPTTLAVLGISLAKSMGFSPLIGGVAGAALGGVILVLVDQTRLSVSTSKY